MKKVKYIVLILIIFLIGRSIYYKNYKSNNIKKEGDMYTLKTFAMDTYIDIKIKGKEKDAKKALEESEKRIEDIEKKLSAHIDSSKLSEINNRKESEVKIDKEIIKIIKKANYYSEKSNGSFDISIYPLVNLWKIGSNQAKVPNKKDIHDSLKHINYKDIKINEEKKTLILKENMKIDLGGIAKGYTADEVKNIIINNNIESGIINLGGNILTVGSKDNITPWNIGIVEPVIGSKDYVGVFKSKGDSIVTSGYYERYFKQDGQIYHHILSPFNGYPAKTNISSVTIISDKGIDGDALSTSIYILGKDNGMKLIESLDSIECIIITDEREIYKSSGIKDSFVLTHDGYIIK